MRRGSENEEGVRQTHDHVYSLVHVDRHPFLIQNRHRTNPSFTKHMHNIKDSRVERGRSERGIRIWRFG